MQSVRRQFKESKLPKPEFDDISGMFRAVVYNGASSVKRHEAVFEGERQKQVLAYLDKNKKAKAKDLAEIMGVSNPALLKDLRELMKQGKVRKIGKFRGAYYELDRN